MDLVLGELEIALINFLFVTARSEQRGLIHKIFQICAGEARC